MSTIDPITFEVLKHRLWQITDEQAIAIKTISASPIVVEGNDFNVGIFTPEGRVVTTGIGSLVHVTTMGTAIEGILREAGEVHDGDVYLTNDPFLGALHQNDVILASPVFHGDRLALWVANVLHHPDVGGIDEGSFCINATSLYQEPARYLLKLADRGVLNRWAERTFVTNSRMEDAVALDLRAQLGAIHVARDRMLGLIDEVGMELVDATMAETLEGAAFSLKKRLTELADGVWEADVFMDGDRVGSDAILKVHVRLEKTGDRMLFDYAGSSPQARAAVNSTLHATYAASLVPVYTYICAGEIDWNDAVKECVRIEAPERSVVNALPPAPVSICTVGFRWLATAAASRVVADMLLASDGFRDRVVPSWSVSANCNYVFAALPDGRVAGALLSDHRAGGAGARTYADGIAHAGQQTSFSSNVANVESVEEKLPVLYLYRRQLADSGGPGRFRGGLTAESALAPFGAEELLLKSTNTAGTDQSNASGIAGGYPGAGSQVYLARGADIHGSLAGGAWPGLDRADLTHLPSKAQATLSSHDVLVFHPPGGGGLGDPLARAPEAVAEDLRQSRVTVEGAWIHYGVRVDADGQVDQGATESERARRRAQRLEDVAEATTVSAPDACAACGTPGGEEGGDVRVTTRPLRAAGPWLAERWAGESPNFHLAETICAACGALRDVTERRTAPGPDSPGFTYQTEELR